MYTNFDYEEERQSEEDRLNQFFGEFSSEARLKLMSKNLVKPQSLYDVFYPSIKKDLMAKNVNLFNTDLDEFSKEIRNNQLAKIVEKAISLEEQSKEFRNSMVARNKLHEDIEHLLELSEQKRKDLLSKNSFSQADLLLDSDSKRNDSLAKNKENPNFEKQMGESQDEFRLENLSKNASKEIDLEADSINFRKDSLAKNSAIVADLEQISSTFRNNELSKNDFKEIDLESNNKDFRKSNLSHNVSKETDLETLSKNFRENELSKNDAKENDLEKDSIDFRKVNLSSNDSKTTDLEFDSIKTRNNVLAKNDPKITDLQTDSFDYRKGNLASNDSKTTDLEVDSISFRNNNLSSNNSIKTDLEKDSADFRNGDLAKNDSKETDLEKDSSNFRKNNLSSNDSKTTDLLTDSEKFKQKNLAGNVEKISNLENDSAAFREIDLSANVQKNSNIETDSNVFRNANLAGNVPATTDLEIDSNAFRNANLAGNGSVVTDLEIDSNAFRNANLAGNGSVVTDLETDSNAFRNANLADNVPVTTDLEIDSNAFRNANLADNVPVTTDLEIDSVPYMNSNLAANVPVTTDLETDSVPYMNNNLASNVPVAIDLGIDSVPYMNSNLAANVPVTTDLETDSVPYINNNLASNVPVATDLETDSVPYMNNNLASNVPTGQVLDSHINQYGGNSNPTDERNHNLAKNVLTHQTIDHHYDQAGGMSSGQNERYLNLNRNVGFGPLGVNVMGFGTSVYLGVSAVWVQGLLFRNLLFLKNKYKAGGVLGVSSSYYTEGDAGVEGLLRDTLKVPSMPEIKHKKALPMTPADVINSNNTVKAARYYSLNTSIKSPIARSLHIAAESALMSKSNLNNYSIDFEKPINIDYKLGNTVSFEKGAILQYNGQNIQYDNNNINTLIRQYLKYSNAYVLDSHGKLINSDNNMNELYQLIKNKQRDGLNDSILDLISSYDIFNLERKQRIQKHTKSINTSTGAYFNSDIETSFNSNFGSESETGGIENIAFKQVAGNPLSEEFQGKRKGVRYTLKSIAEKDSSSNLLAFNKNFIDIQGRRGEISKSFVIGKKNDSPKIAYQKYTIQNPYSSANGIGKAGTLVLSFKNYSIPADQGKTMYFPPYISSFQNSDSANWNSTNFLGRPEAVYTYNNSSRDGSISFFVLSDYAERVLIGRNQNETQSEIFVNLNKNFTDQSKMQKIDVMDLNALQKSQEDSIKRDKKKQTEETSDFGGQPKDVAGQEGSGGNAQAGGGTGTGGNSSETADINKKIDDKKSEAELTKTSANKANKLLPGIEVLARSGANTPYKESNGNMTNVNDFFMNEQKEYDDGYIESKPSDNLKRINNMLEGLLFQPAYFSGNLVDFKRRMEFLSKMTRPANNTPNMKLNDTTGQWEGGSGFSFTKPPVCHMRLGDWFNHDIIVNSVSYDYSNAPWTLDDNGKNQPMWASVTVSFNIVGPAGNSGGVPLTSSDIDGFFGTSTTRR